MAKARVSLGLLSALGCSVITNPSELEQAPIPTVDSGMNGTDMGMPRPDTSSGPDVGAVPCDGPRGCGPGEYCRIPDGVCGASELARCEAVPSTCPSGERPVCGCDGQSYCGRCLAAQAGVNVQAEGACIGTSPSCDAVCASESKAVTCNGETMCVPRPATCTPMVCGCDNVIYASSCVAWELGVGTVDISACPMQPPCCRNDADCATGDACAVSMASDRGVCVPAPPMGQCFNDADCRVGTVTRCEGAVLCASSCGPGCVVRPGMCVVGL